MQPMTDPAAERAVLAAVFQGGSEVYDDVADILTSRSFTVDSNQVIWSCLEKACKDQTNATLDYPTFLSSARSLGVESVFEKASEVTHLRSIMHMPVRRENIRRMAAVVRKLEIARLLDAQLDLGKQHLANVKGDEPIDSILMGVEQPIFDLTSLLADSTDKGVELMGAGAEEYVQYLIDNPREMVGISTGMPRFDMAIGGGLRPGAMDVIASRPKTGKTMLADKFSMHIASRLGIPVLNIDTEMSQHEHLHRILASMAGIPIRSIECGKMSPDEQERVRAAARALRDYPYYYRCVAGDEFEDTLSQIRRWVLRNVGIGDNGKAKPCVVIYDYLKLTSSESISKGNLTEWQRMGFIATALKNFATRYQVPILTFAQLNRDGIDKEDTSAISQSDRIIWFCTSCSIYKWKTAEEKASEPHGSEKYTHKLIPIVSRYGEGLPDGDYINIRANYKVGRIEEGPTRRELESGVRPGGVTIHGANQQDPIDFSA